MHSESSSSDQRVVGYWLLITGECEGKDSGSGQPIGRFRLKPPVEKGDRLNRHLNSG